ncbi:glycoside hydrolase family 2 TIM barrel-domain containing protein [Muribaculum intestinale]|uniref:glycoside hydrolase family 2 TIM barrel-domain containing protein n=1 Tax=Muribaculum intestinale TaxID=1796646 RepID=UPI00263A42E2|nr:glycoside hydrolase family 2 TIM barrel-domain containing protein [Muribaculum intestinale]
MKLHRLIISAFASCLALHSLGDVHNINFGWKFSPGDIAGAEAVEFNDDAWGTVNLPHDFQIHQPWVEPSADERPDLSNQMANITSRLSSRGFKEMGSGWYRKNFTPDPAWKGRRVLLDFEGIMLVGDVYLNGERIGGTDYGYLGFEIDVTGKLKYGETNVIAVKTDTGKPENSRWYTGGGLYRDVNIKVTDPKQYFTRHALSITTPIVSRKHSSVVVNAEIATRIKADSITVGIDIIDNAGDTVYSAKKNHWNFRRQKVREFRLDSITISNPSLWDCDNPNLYTLEATLYRPDGTVADKVSERFGIRSVEFSPEFGLKLNGEKVLLKGIANHHSLGALGAAAYPRAMEKRIQLLKEFGFNHIRTSHNPYSESFLDLCDEYGILVVDELYDKWTTQYAGGRTHWTERWQKDIPEWVRRDRNHPSVIFWSLGNELQLIPDLPFNDWGVTPYKLQKALLQRYDDAHRPVTVAMHPRGRNERTDSLPAPLVMVTDIASYNYRYMYFPGDSRRFPWMMFYQSEANTSNLGPNFFEMNLGKVLGLAYWGMIDYLGESQGWPAKGWAQGVFDISLSPKPMAYFLRSFFKPDEPIVHIAPFEETGTTQWNGVTMGGKRFTDSWNFNRGDSINIYTYTNADEVELRINGKSLGRKRNAISDPKSRNRILWENIAYSPGKIEAIAYRDGEKKPIARHSLSTTGRAVKLQATADNDAWRADGLDLQHISVEALDSKGRRDKSASETLTFSVDGPAEIVGVINGDINSNELTVGDSRSLYNGTATVILRSTREPGRVTLSVTSSTLGRLKKAFDTTL